MEQKKERTLQEVYDQVARHLMTQGERCTDSSGRLSSWGCRLQDGEKSCAIGSLIPKEKYRPQMESILLIRLIDEGHLGEGITRSHWDLLASLRVIHDNHAPSEWSKKLSQLESTMGLLAWDRT